MKKILQLFTCAVAVLFATNTVAQNQSRCYTDEYNAQLQQDPAIRASMEAAEQASNEWLKKNGNNFRTSGSTIVIPCVVHIMWSTAAQNLYNDIIKSQIDVLNEDYGGYNSDITKTPSFFRDRRAMDTGIRFELANRDPSGNPTNGIVRVYTTNPSNTASPAWPNTSYLNIWVYNLGGGLLGFAQFPGGPANTDGVNILYSSFGRVSPGGTYSYGRTATHEIGHWLGLRHVWGDANCGNDLISDTPTQQAYNFGCPSCHGFTCSNQPTGDMYMNYMDYVDDLCMYMFSQGQSTRAWSFLNGSRVALQTSLGNNIVSSPVLDAGITSITKPDMIPCENTNISFAPELTIQNFGTTTLTSATINYKVDNTTTLTYAWSGSLANGADATVTLPTVTVASAGNHMFYAWTDLPNGGTDLDASNNRTSRNFIGHTANIPFPLTQGFELSTFPPAGWANRNYDCGTGWARTTTASHSGVASALFNNFTAPATLNGVRDELTSQPVDMTLAPATSAALKFWVAYAPKSTTGFDTLEVFVSTDCGESFTSVFKEWNTALATAPAQTTAFVPTAGQWVEKTISLSPYIGVKNLVVVFRNTNHGGNNLYIDDMNVISVGINEIISGVDLNIFPNPAQSVLNIQTKLENAQEVQIKMFDAVGKIIYQSVPKTTTGEVTTININSFAKGIYFLKLNTEKGSLLRKVILTE